MAQLKGTKCRKQRPATDPGKTSRTPGFRSAFRLRLLRRFLPYHHLRLEGKGENKYFH